MRRKSYLAATAAMFAATVMAGAPAVAASATAPEAAPAPVAAKKSSWALHSEVNFNGSTLPDGCIKYSGEYTAGNSAWSESNAVMSGGELKLEVEKKKTDGQPYTTGGVGCWSWGQTYGKFEVKAKVPAGKGINSYLTLSPSKDSSNALTSIELLAPDQDTAYVSNGYGKGSEQAFSEQNFANKKFHTYTIEWAPKHLLVRLDGKEIFYSTNSYKGSRWISMATTTGDDLTGKPTSKTKLPAAFTITQMKIYRYTGTKPTPGKTLSVGTDGTVAGATPTASGSPGATATPTATPTTAAAASEGSSGSSGGGKLTGGIWPWLIGGSIMAVSAIAILSYPNRKKQPPRRQPSQPYTR
ncbi:glycoside hydrolase family 16 protein [Kineosporia sp. NBRC 101731]|uniref:glycoside hydrolase family 16 protein n=1 Tax=Kineosporia sp. NBRC 101731 TaxID=3032199 RepID=UPI002557519E|nr:glycoside hydrolase family 16 protein [Kineosporia sp. NBRC 101731]